MDAHHTEWGNVSITYMSMVQATEADECVLQVVVLPQSSSPNAEHKFKVMGLIVSNGATPLDDMTGKIFVRWTAGETWGKDTTTSGR